MQSLYKPRPCAFHPTEMIFNFCQNQGCLLPLCPTCVQTHGEEHRSEDSYGSFETMTKVTSKVQEFYTITLSETQSMLEDIKEDTSDKVKAQKELTKKIQAARNKMVAAIDRFFNDFQKETAQSFNAYNDNLKENYSAIGQKINVIEKSLHHKLKALSTEKVLKTVIAFYSKHQAQKLDSQIGSLKQELSTFRLQKAELKCQDTAIQKVVNQLQQFIHLEFYNYKHAIQYKQQFVKTGMSNHNTKQSFYHQ